MKTNVIYNMDCLEGMKKLPDKSIDMILCDLPYGTTPTSWDKIIPIKELWIEYERIIKEKGVIVLTSQQPFTSLLISSNLKLYKYNWIWKKDNATNFLNSNYQPMKITEDICVFGKGATSYTKNNNNLRYNPQKTKGKAYSIKSGNQKLNSAVVRGGKGGRTDVSGYNTENKGDRMPVNIIEFKRDKEKLHPTQKPIELFKYLIKTYTDENHIVLDNCIGSGTTAIACKELNRQYIGFEISEKYCEIAEKRLQKT